MLNSTGIYKLKIGTKNIDINKMQLFLVGFMTMIHTLMLFPYELYALIIAIMLLVWGVCIARGKQVIISKNLKKYFLWYGIFTLFVVASSIYTVNTINPDYVIKRILVIFALCTLVATYLKTEDDFNDLSNGLIVGGLCLVFAVYILENASLGNNRIGLYTVGSAVALSGFMLVGFICASWRSMFHKEHRKFYCVCMLIFFAVIALTGSRRALIVSVGTIIAFIFMNRNINLKKKLIILLLSIICILMIIYYIFNNEVLYSIIGWRLDSMLQSLFGNVNDFTDASMIERNTMKEYAYDLFTERPLLGYGVHGFAYMFNNYYGLLLYSHDGFAEILSCYGIIGFLLFYSIFPKLLFKWKYIFFYGTTLQKILLLYVILTFLSEPVTIAFITSHTMILLVASCNLLIK